MAEAFLSGVIIMFILLFVVFFVGDYAAKSLGFSSGAASPVAAFLGIPEETAKWPNALWYIIMPMMATLGIIYGFFEELHIFRHAPNQSVIYTIIGIAWSGLLMYTGALKILAVVFYQLGALMAAIVFSLVFIAGVVMWGVFRTKGMYGELRIGSMGDRFRAANDLIKELGNYEKVLDKYYKKYGANLENAPENIKTSVREMETRSANFVQRLDIDLKGDLNKEQISKFEKLKNWFNDKVMKRGSGFSPSVHMSA